MSRRIEPKELYMHDNEAITLALAHGGRPTKSPNQRKRKGAVEYAAEFSDDFTHSVIMRNGENMKVLVCRYCWQTIGARSDRIKEHLASKRHQRIKQEAANEAQLLLETQSSSDQDGDFGSFEEDSEDNLRAPENPDGLLMNGNILQRDDLESNSETAKAMETEITPVNGTMKDMTLAPAFTPHHQVPISSNTSNPIGPQESPSSQEDSSEEFTILLKWENKFSSNLISMLSKYKNQRSYIDVTLYCEGKVFHCHKLILSASSTYFESLFTETSVAHPIIFCKDLKAWELESLLEFMYKGEVRIQQEKLHSLIRAAESLRVKGLWFPSADESSCTSHTQSNISNILDSQQTGNNYTGHAINDERHDATSHETLNNCNGGTFVPSNQHAKNNNLTKPQLELPRQKSFSEAHQTKLIKSTNKLNNLDSFHNESFENITLKNDLSLRNPSAKPVHYMLDTSVLFGKNETSKSLVSEVNAKRRKCSTPRRIQPSPPPTFPAQSVSQVQDQSYLPSFQEIASTNSVVNGQTNKTEVKNGSESFYSDFFGRNNRMKFNTKLTKAKQSLLSGNSAYKQKEAAKNGSGSGKPGVKLPEGFMNFGW